MPPTLVSVNTHEAITLVVSGGGLVGAVDWDLVVVGPQAVTMCVRVGEQASLFGEGGQGREGRGGITVLVQDTLEQ